MRIMTALTAGLTASFLLASTPAGATTISLFTLPEGNTILQVTGALGLDTSGGLATTETRTLYYFEPDFGDPAPNEHDFTGTTWPYVFVDGPIKVDPDISAVIETVSSAFGDFLLINGNPVYQFAGDSGPKDANGNFGPWFYIQRDGSPTQSSVVPIPAALPLMMSAFVALGLFRRRRA